MRFNSLNARENAAKSQEARRINRLSSKLAKEAASQVTQANAQTAGDAYISARLSRVRIQLDRLDAMLMIENDPTRLDRLASAQSRLAEQERILSGRPLPGSRRPAKEPSRAGTQPDWRNHTPTPANPAASTSPGWRNFIPRPAQEPG